MTAPERIVLTADADQQAKLRRKLKEYDVRLEFQAPEVDLHATYKQRILKELLEKGFVVAEELLASLTASIGAARPRDFSDAMCIIAGYNANDLSKIIGGSGLG